MSQQLEFALQPHSSSLTSSPQPSEIAYNSFSQFVSSLTLKEQLAELDEEYLQTHFSLKEAHSRLNLKSIQKIYSHILHKQITDKKMKKNWTDDETSLLIWISSVFSKQFKSDPAEFVKNNETWKQISTMIPYKAYENCKLRWLYLKKNNVQGAPWTEEEDQSLMEIIKKKGASSNKWNEIAKELQTCLVSKSFRKGKQCRERWNNHLDPDMKRGQWTIREDLQLLKLSFENGNKWSFIAKQLKERTENAVKNRYKSLLRKEEKENKASGITFQNEQKNVTGGDPCLNQKSIEQKKIWSIIGKLQSRIKLGLDEDAIEEEEEQQQYQSDEEAENNQEQKKMDHTEDQFTQILGNISKVKNQYQFSDMLNSPIKIIQSQLQKDEETKSQVNTPSLKHLLEFSSNLKTNSDFKEEQYETSSSEKLSLNNIPSNFTEAIQIEKFDENANKTEGTGSTGSSFTPQQQSQLLGFSHRTSIQSCDTLYEKSKAHQTPQANPHYMNMIPSSPCSLLIQNFSNLRLNSQENTPSAKRRNTYHDGECQLSTLNFEQFHKQRKLSSMQEEQEECGQLSETPKMKKIIVLAGYSQMKNIGQGELMIHGEKKEGESCNSSNSQGVGHSQVGSDQSISLEDISTNKPILNQFNYSPNNSAFRQVHSPPLPLQNKKVQGSRRSLPSEKSQNLSSPFFLSSSSFSTPVSQMKGFKKTKAFSSNQNNLFGLNSVLQQKSFSLKSPFSMASLASNQTEQN